MKTSFSRATFEAHRTSSPILEKALRILSVDVQSKDGVANAAILEGAQRIAELRALLLECSPHVLASVDAEHLLDGFKRKARPLDDLAIRLRQELANPSTPD